MVDKIDTIKDVLECYALEKLGPSHPEEIRLFLSQKDEEELFELISQTEPHLEFDFEDLRRAIELIA